MSEEGKSDKAVSVGRKREMCSSSIFRPPYTFTHFFFILVLRRRDETLPGATRGDSSSYRTLHPEVRSKAVQIAPTGRSFAVASTEGLLIYSLDETLFFDPFELGEDVTLSGVYEALEEKSYARALLFALHVNDEKAIIACLESIPLETISLVSRVVPAVFIPRIVQLVASSLHPGIPSSSPHIDFFLVWALCILQNGYKVMRERPTNFVGVLRSLQKAIIAQRDALLKVAEENTLLLSFLCASSELA